MSIVRVTKEFTFDMAHALAGYNGKCRHIHGHTYFLSVTVTGKPITCTDNPQTGMVIDFTDLKEIVNEEIIKHFDHTLVVWQADERVNEWPSDNRIVVTPYQPTCENMLIDFVSRLRRHFEGPVKLHSVMLRETPTSYATWFASDNE